MIAQRAALWSLRPTAGWPILTVAMIERIARTNNATPTTAMVRDTTMAKICMMLLSCRDDCVRSVGRVRHCVAGRALRVRPYLAVDLEAGSAADEDAPAFAGCIRTAAGRTSAPAWAGARKQAPASRAAAPAAESGPRSRRTTAG